MNDTFHKEEEDENTRYKDKETRNTLGDPAYFEDPSDIMIQSTYDIEEDNFCEELKQQVQQELELIEEEAAQLEIKHPGRLRKIWMVSGIVLGVLMLLSLWMVGTRSGRSIIYKIAGGFISRSMEKEDAVITDKGIPVSNKTSDSSHSSINDNANKISEPGKILPVPRKEDYVSNYLIFGVEEIEHAKNTDTIMLVSVNTQDNTIKLTSLLRDTLIELTNQDPVKLNSVFARDGANELVDVIEQSYLVDIDGYAYINFNSFEAIINYLGGISIELGKEEAHYLNTTNYISIKENRNVKPGWNVLNGNQVLGYCRVRRCVTLGGANDDYGRTLRQRRVLEAIFNRYKSKNILDLLFMMDNMLGYIKTNLTASQIEKLLGDIVENKVTKMNTFRVPVNGKFETPRSYSGIDDPLVIDWVENRKELYQFIYNDSEEEAIAALEEE